jgi:hypothetical protein
MAHAEVLIDILDDLAERLHQTVAGIPYAAIAWRPDSEANSIALTLWHVARAFDVLNTRVLAQQPPEQELWQTAGWAARTGYDPRGIGYAGIGNLSGYTQVEVAAVPVLAADDLLAYFDQASSALRASLAALPAEMLHPPAELLPDQPPPYIWARNFLMDAREHLGEIKAVKAMWERRQRFSRAELRDRLALVREELDRTPAVQTAERRELERTISEIQDLLDRSGEPEDAEFRAAGDRLGDSVLRVEAEHPQLSLVMSQVVEMLNRIGI